MQTLKEENKLPAWLICIGFLLITASSQAQKDSKNVVEVVGSAFANSRRFDVWNGDPGIYKELRYHRRFTNYFEAGLFVGHQWRSYIYVREVNGNQMLLFMDRHYLPAGINVRIHLTDFFSNKLHLVKRKDKWDFYNQIVVARLFGKDIRDQSETPNDQIVYLRPYIIDYGKVYVGLLFGVTYYPGKNIGFFLEGGEGAIATVQVGAKFRF